MLDDISNGQKIR